MVKRFALLHNCPFTKIVCSYGNSTTQIQIIRITNISNCYLERVVLPGQRLIFAATPEAQLEIHTNTNITTIILDKISCQDLILNESNRSCLEQ